MKATRIMSIVLAMVVMFGAAHAEDAPKSKTMSASEAFEFFTSVDGQWTAKTVTVPVGTPKEKGEAKDSKISYETVANGSTVMGTYYKGSPMQMIDMIHQDGPEALRLTHYCAVGNQPRMKFVPSDEVGVIQFAFDGGSNMDESSDGHVHDAKVRVLGKDRFEVETRLWQGGEHAMTTYFELTRDK